MAEKKTYGKTASGKPITRLVDVVAGFGLVGELVDELVALTQRAERDHETTSSGDPQGAA